MMSEAKKDDSDLSALLYRSLNRGEEIKEGDQMLLENVGWIRIGERQGVSGMDYTPGYHMPMRRAI
jgi:hypothetical protein